jgi:hypothetical protein
MVSYVFRFYQTIFSPLFTICKYILCAHTLRYPIVSE